MRRVVSQHFLLASLLLIVFSQLTLGATSHKPVQPRTVLLEAKGIAAAIENRTERFALLDQIVRAQIAIHPADARDTLQEFPKLPNRLNHFSLLASGYAKTGNVVEAERMYAEIAIDSQLSPQGKLAAATALAYLAVAQANAGKVDESFQTLQGVKERAGEKSLQIADVATAEIAQAQAQHGDVEGAVRTAVGILGKNPFPLMAIMRNLMLKEDVRRVDHIISTLDEGAQPYAQWGLVQALIKQERLTDAQVTASAIRPGHAKANALLELATFHTGHGDKALALVLLKEAAESAKAITNNSTRAETFSHIATGLANGGNAALAVEIAKSIEIDGQRNSALHDVAIAQAQQGDTGGAFNTALMLTKVTLQDGSGADGYTTTLAHILAELVRRGKAGEARNRLSQLKDLGGSYPLFYSEIAVAQADLGLIPDAKTSLASIETEAQRVARTKELKRLTEKPAEFRSPEEQSRVRALSNIEKARERALGAIALALTRKGALSEATTMTVKFSTPSRRLETLREVGIVQSQSGRTQTALKWARALPSPAEKVYALLGIAEGRPTSQSSTPRPSSKSPNQRP